ncbi:MAG: PorV/PorQ family protein [Elusimicrobia bacterium]|nr:PorV/PorQ family protein [Elusimicrobiota bacterium]
MKRISIVFFACLGLLGGRAAAWAISDQAGTGGAQFLKLKQGSARAMALGESYVALAEGADALTWNPAGLALAQQKEWTYSYLRYIEEVDSPLYMGYAHPMGRTVWGANVSYLSVSGFDARDSAGVPQTGENVSVRDGFATLAVARSFWYEKLFLGGGLRVVHEDLANSVHDTVVGDFGLLLKPNSTLTLGFAVQNFGTNRENVPSTTRGGAALRLGDFFNLGLELSQASDSNAHFGVGGEFLLPEQYLDVGQVTFRMGYHNADSHGQSFDGTLKSLRLDRSSGLSFGFGLFTSRAFGYGIALDYAYMPFGAFGTVDQFSFKVKF